MAIMTLLLDDFERITLGLLLDSLEYHETRSAGDLEYDVAIINVVVTREERERLLDMKACLLDPIDEPENPVRKMKKWRGSQKFKVGGCVISAGQHVRI